MILFMGFGFVCANCFGGDISHFNTVLELYPNNWFAWTVKFLFCINLFFSYPLLLYPITVTLESYLYKGWPKSKKRHWFKNITRALEVLTTVVVTLVIGQKIQSYLAIGGAVTCAPLAFTLPALFHYKTCAETTWEKFRDLAIAILSIGILLFTAIFGIINW